MARTHRYVWALFSAVALAATLLLSRAAPAQTPPADAAPAAAVAPAPPSPLPYAEIPVRADEVLRLLREIEDRLASSESLVRLEHQVRAGAELVANAGRNTARLLAEGSSLESLADAEREWLAREQELGTWRKLLAGQSAAIDRDQQRLDSLRAVWLATQEAAERRPHPEGGRAADAGLEWIGRVLDAIAATRAHLGQREQALLERQAEVADIQSRIDTRLAEVRDAQSDRRRRLFAPDSPPLWRARPSSDRAGELAQVREDWTRELGAMATYLESNRSRFALHLSVLLASLVTALAIRRRVGAWSSEDPDLGEVAVALRRPVSVALLVGLLSGVWIHPLAPSVLADLSGVLMLLPAVRLLTPLISPVYRMPLFGLAVFFLASQLRGLLDAATFLPRMMLTAELLTGIAFLVWLRRPARLAAIEPGDPLLPYLRAGVPVLLGLVGVALLADVFGYVALARILARGGLRSVWTALVLFTTYRILLAWVRVLLRTAPARSIRSVRTGAASIQRWLARGLVLIGAGIWVVTSLRSFAIDTAVLGAAKGLLTADIELGTAAFSLADVLAFAGTLLAAWLLSRFVRFLLEEDVYPRLLLSRGIPNAISTLVQYALLLAGLVLALAAAGLDLSRITLLAGAFGVGIGFGLQNVVNNFVSGLILLFERPIQVGDTIEIQGLVGEVRRIGPRSSTVWTYDGAEVIVPNGALISDRVTNWTLSDRRRRITVGVGVAYGTDPGRVLGLLREVAAESQVVLRDPEPVAIFTGFGASSLDFELRCWISRYEEGSVTQSALRVALRAKLAAAGIEIPFPQSDVHVRSVTAGAAVPAPPSATGEPPR